MPTPAERRALLFVATVAALGTAVRGARVLGRDEVSRTDRTALADQIARVDSAITSGGRRAPSARKAKTAPPLPRTPRADPLEALRRAPLDLDRATAEEMDGLPGIGPALAARIVADREANGEFGSIEALQRVKGVGPALAARLAPFVTFSGAGRPSSMDPRTRPRSAPDPSLTLSPSAGHLHRLWHPQRPPAAANGSVTSS